MDSSVRMNIISWCALIIAVSILLGYFTGPSGYIVPMVTGGMVTINLIRGRRVPLAAKFESLNLQFLVPFLVFTSILMLFSYVFGFLFLS